MTNNSTTNSCCWVGEKRKRRRGVTTAIIVLCCCCVLGYLGTYILVKDVNDGQGSVGRRGGSSRISSSLSTVTRKKIPSTATATGIISPITNNNILSATHRQKQTLPSFRNGGVIFFYHIYKTGGSTVGKMLHEIAHNHPHKMHFEMVRKQVDWKMCQWALNMAQHNHKIVILEFHIEYPAPEFPTLTELETTIVRWREEAHRRKLDFFSFTLVREPVSHAISFFNFFSVGSTSPTELVKEWNPFRRMDASEKNLMKSFVGNRQCQMFGTDAESTGSVAVEFLRHPPTISENDDNNNKLLRIEPSLRDDEFNYINACPHDKVKNVLYESLDWVGTTEQLSTVTLPLLTKVLLNNATIGTTIEPFKVFDNNLHGMVGVKKRDLSDHALDRIVEETQLDRDIYNEVVKNNTLAGLGLDTNFRIIRRR